MKKIIRHKSRGLGVMTDIADIISQEYPVDVSVKFISSAPVELKGFSELRYSTEDKEEDCD